MGRALLFALTLLSLPALAVELKPFSASYTADWKQLPVSGSAERSLEALDNDVWKLNFEASMLVASLTPWLSTPCSDACRTAQVAASAEAWSAPAD